jgi:hypothetical protein
MPLGNPCETWDYGTVLAPVPSTGSSMDPIAENRIRYPQQSIESLSTIADVPERREHCVKFELYAVSKNHNRVTWDFDENTKSRIGESLDIAKWLKERVANLKSTLRVCFVLHGSNARWEHMVRTRISSIVEAKSSAQILISVQYDRDPNEHRSHPSRKSYSRRKKLNQVDGRDDVITAYDIASMCFRVAEEHNTRCNVVVLPRYDLRRSFP